MMPRIGMKDIKQIETSEPSDTTLHWRGLPELPVTSTAPPTPVKAGRLDYSCKSDKVLVTE